MFDYATDLRDDLLASLAGGDPFSRAPASRAEEKLADHIYKVLAAKDRDGVIDLPGAVQSHNMRLGQAFTELRTRPSSPRDRRYLLKELITWLCRAHYWDITSLGRQMHRDAPDMPPERALPILCQKARDLLESGTFGKDYAWSTDLGRSAWNGLNYELHLEDWRVILRAGHHGPIRMGTIQEPLREAPVPQTREVEMRFPSGKLLIASDAVIPALAEQHVKMRQDAEMKGLKRDLEITDEILFTNAMIALPVHCRSVMPLREGGEFSLVAPRPSDDEEDPDQQTFLLDYRHLFVADERACLEALRTNLKDTDDILAERLAEARAASTLRVTEIEIDPGHYQVVLPANHSRMLPETHSCLGREHHVLLNLKKVG